MPLVLCKKRDAFDPETLGRFLSLPDFPFRRASSFTSDPPFRDTMLDLFICTAESNSTFPRNDAILTPVVVNLRTEAEKKGSIYDSMGPLEELLTASHILPIHYIL